MTIRPGISSMARGRRHSSSSSGLCPGETPAAGASPREGETMTRQKGGAAALAASKGHLEAGVDNGSGPAGKADQDQGDGAGGPVDNAGEEGRLPFVLSDE